MHRKQASVYDVAKLLPCYAGTLVGAEVKVLEQLAKAGERPYAVVLGGSKVSDKLAVIENLAGKADSPSSAAACASPSLPHKGSRWAPRCCRRMVDTCRRLLEEYGDVIHLPVDVVVAAEFKADSPAETVDVKNIPADKMGLDIGPESVARFSTLLSNARTIFWNGPMGVFGVPGLRQAPRGWPRPSSPPPPRALSASSAVATPLPRCASSVWPRTVSPTSPPVAARRWNSSRARPRPVSTS